MAPMLFVAMIASQSDPAPVYKDPKAPVESRIEDALSRLTLEEKVSLLYGQDSMSLHGVPRLDIPSLTMSDGPVGARWGKATAFPASIATASSWDLDLMKRVAQAMGKEFKYRGRAVALGPCVGVVRVPHGGRNFESFGEDPYFNGEMAAAYIQGMQSQKVVACVKHYALNNQEYERMSVDIRADERTMRELDLRVFEAAIKKGGALSIMPAYNKVNGEHCTENPFLLDQVLKKDWGFQGFSVSDWGAVHSTAPCANAGLDVEMPGPNGWWGEGKLLNATKEGQVPEKTIDEMCRRVLRAIFWSGLFDEPRPQHDDEVVENRAIALEAAQNGIVLLKNRSNALPLDPKKIKKLALIGPYANTAATGGGGSSRIDPFYSVTPLQGIRERLGDKVELLHVAALDYNGLPGEGLSKGVVLTTPDGKSAGLLGEYFANTSLAGDPLVTRIDKKVDFDFGDKSPVKGVPKEQYGIRWTKTGAYRIGMVCDDGCRVFLDDKNVVDNWKEHGAESHTAEVKLVAGQSHTLRLEYFNAKMLGVARFVCQSAAAATAEAIDAASQADAAVVFVGMNDRLEGEGWDRPDYGLPGEQEALVKAVAKANKRTVVVLVGGSQFRMDGWAGDVPAIVESWYLGQEMGNAVADVLLGKFNPSAKLTMSFVKTWEDHWAHDNYPGNQYSEGVFLGYRHLDRKSIEPQFPFGHGLSYTTFAYRDLAVTGGGSSWTVTLKVKNTGKREGKEIAQVYVAPPAGTTNRPPKELKGFVKVALKPGEEKTVTVALGPDAFTYFDEGRKGWFAPAGSYSVLVGASSRDIRLQGKVGLAEEVTQPVTRKL
jgi:beta-glucosidase